MSFWFLASLHFGVRPKTLLQVVGSAICFGLAVLSKETAIIFLPVYLGLIYITSHKIHRNFAVILWAVLAIGIISLYPMTALIKGEFFPSGTILGGANPHVSLLQAWQFQTNRLSAPTAASQSTLQFALQTQWLFYGYSLLVVGLITSGANLLLRKSKEHIVFSLFSLSFCVYLSISTLILTYYVIPLIPLLCINAALFLSSLPSVFSFIPRQISLSGYRAILLTLTGFFVQQFLNAPYLYIADQTNNQIASIEWIKRSIQTPAVMLIDNYSYVDLNVPRFAGDTTVQGYYYWKPDSDPEVKGKAFMDEWRSVDYLLVTPAFIQTMNANTLPIIRNAYQNSEVLQRFDAPDHTGYTYPVEIRRVRKPNNVAQTN